MLKYLIIVSNYYKSKNMKVKWAIKSINWLKGSFKYFLYNRRSTKGNLSESFVFSFVLDKFFIEKFLIPSYFTKFIIFIARETIPVNK